jgi:hypothetical protein
VNPEPWTLNSKTQNSRLDGGEAVLIAREGYGAASLY